MLAKVKNADRQDWYISCYNFSVPLLRDLPAYKLAKIADVLEVVRFSFFHHPATLSLMQGKENGLIKRIVLVEMGFQGLI